jgi:quinol monooxygenase YgiN
MPVIYVIATLQAKPEKITILLPAAKAMIAATLKEEGCQSYDLHQSISDPSLCVFVERWTTREALTRHFETEHMKVWRAVCGECLVGRKVEIIAPEKVEVL